MSNVVVPQHIQQTISTDDSNNQSNNEILSRNRKRKIQRETLQRQTKERGQKKEEMITQLFPLNELADMVQKKEEEN